MKLKLEEAKRLLNLCAYEDDLFSNGYKYIAGIDEVGRGALAGPLVVAAVIMDRSKLMIEGLNDSKKVLSKKREFIFRKIIANCLSWSVSKIPPKLIDEISMKNANVMAAELAVKKLKIKPDIIITDFIDIKVDTEVVPLVNGDEICASVAAASIVAKVVRDKIMIKLSRRYPVYGFDSNKGYGTKKHLEAIKLYGPTAVHRMSFRGVLE